MTTLKKLFLVATLSLATQHNLQALYPYQVEEIIDFKKELLEQKNLQAHIVAGWLPGKMDESTSDEQAILLKIIDSPSHIEDKVNSLLAIKTSDATKKFNKLVFAAIAVATAPLAIAGYFYYLYELEKRTSGWD